MITSINVGGLEVGVSDDYFVTTDTLSFLKAAQPADPVLVARQGADPAYIRSQPREKSGTIIVGLLGTSLQAREALYDAVVAACDMSSGLVAVIWTEVLGTTKVYTLWCHLSGAEPDEWYTRATIAAVAPSAATVA